MDQQGPFVREYGPYLVLSQKNNIICRQFYSQSAAMGLWLGGVTHQHGAWEDGGFYWQNAGFKELGVSAGERSGVLSTMPRCAAMLATHTRAAEPSLRTPDLGGN